jgi:HAD superfamily hydrolase (TIGR01490 family)
LNLAIFDLDNTLLAGDSDYLWGEFLAEKGLVDGHWYKKENDRFYEQYKAGTLDIFEFLSFSLKPLSEHDLGFLSKLHREFMQQKILPIISSSARALVENHKQQGHMPLIITATNLFVTAPIATEFGVDTIIATEPEMIDNRYTGKVKGTPCFQHGKVERLQQWMDEHGHSLNDSWFYSDSHNDIPLLMKVTHPVAVDPDAELKKQAMQAGWQIISLHNHT